MFSRILLKCKNILQTAKEVFTKTECKSDIKITKNDP